MGPGPKTPRKTINQSINQSIPSPCASPSAFSILPHCPAKSYRSSAPLFHRHSTYLPESILSQYQYLFIIMSPSPSLVWCSSCRKQRRSEDFGTLKSGGLTKTCLIHRKKRSLEASLDSWDSFITELSEWNHPVQFAYSKLSKHESDESRVNQAQ